MDTPLSKSVTVKASKTTIGKFEADTEIYVPKSFPQPGEEPMWMFKAYELRYLDALHRGEDPEKAIADSGMTRLHVDWLLKRKKAGDYMGQLLRQKMAAAAWTQDRWISEGTEVWEGKKKATREQMEAWRELGSRICPKPEKSSNGSEKVVININVGAAESALKRQAIIEVQSVEGSVNESA